MLFPYQFLDHKMNKMQEYIQFILEDVWCIAIDGMDYDINTLFAAKPDLRDMIIELDTQEVAGANNFLIPLHSLFETFKSLNVDQKQQFKYWFALNNDIEKLCEQGDQCEPATYDLVEVNYPKDQYPNLVSNLKVFYTNLYSGNFLTLSSVKSRIGEISLHNHEFTKLNDKDVCPFCGLSGILGQYHEKREAYDHYFPKGKYPFNSINFHNLVPACTHCNSSYKLAKDPNIEKADTAKAKAKNPLKVRRKVFYPYANYTNLLTLTLQIQTQDWENIAPSEVSLEMGPDVINSELETWDDLYGITKRYKAECCSKASGKEWLTEIFDLAKRRGKSPRDYIEDLAITCERNPYAEKRFLKRAFLDGCERAGLFDS